MSNLERDPDETLAGGLATVSNAPTRRVLEPREVPLGGTRAMLVRRTLPHRDLPTVGAWCFADDYGPSDVRGSAGMHVPPHPHTGLQTVTWLLEGEVHHQDGVGSDQLVRPGQLSLMTAGRGIAHAETSPADHPPTLRGVQLWVALPETDRHIAPAFEHHAVLPVVRTAGLTATLIVGVLAGERSPATAYTPLVGADVVVESDGAGRVPLDPTFEHAVLVLSGDVVVAGEPVADAHLVYLGCGRRDLTLSAGRAVACCCSGASRSPKSCSCGGTSSAATTTRSSRTAPSGRPPEGARRRGSRRFRPTTVRPCPPRSCRRSASGHGAGADPARRRLRRPDSGDKGPGQSV